MSRKHKNAHLAYFDGVIDEVMIWKRSLSEIEIKQLYGLLGGK
jgi:hypothetical protein